MRYYLITLFLSIAMSAFAADEVVVIQSTGQTSWEISKIKELTFDGNGVKFSFNDNTSVYYDKGSLSMIKFDTTLSGINSILIHCIKVHTAFRNHGRNNNSR